MLLAILTLSCFALGSSAFVEENLCFGDTLRIPFEYRPRFFSGRIYFTPSKKGGSRKLIMENGEMKDPRLRDSTYSIRLTDLTERDDGTFSISFSDNSIYDIIKLNISKCAEEVERSYMTRYSRKIPREVQYLEFTPISSLDTPRILWNRTDPQTNTGGRGHVKHNYWEIVELTEADNGFYNFRKKDNTLDFRIQLIVKEYTRHYDAKVNERLHIRYPLPVSFTPRNMTFTPKGKRTSIMLMEDGSLVSGNHSMSEILNLIGRIQLLNDGMEIDPVESTDSGVFEFRDHKGNLALTVQVEVEQKYAYVYVALIVGIVLMVIVCFCCLKKRCCKKNSAPKTTATPTVHYHNTIKLEDPSYSAAQPASAYQPLNPLGTREPTREPAREPTREPTSLGPPAYNTVDIHVNPTQPEVAVPGGQGAAPALSVGSDYLSSDSVPKFELKGVNFPSAPPLSSDSAYSDVYTSDKFSVGSAPKVQSGAELNSI